MQKQTREWNRTRATLIKRLKNWQDQASWQDFFDTYWKLIFGVAIKSGLSEAEAQDVVQETMFSVAKHMPNFTYDRALGSFKTWLLTMTRWRINDQFRKRSPTRSSRSHSDNDSNPGATAALDNIADEKGFDLESLWDAEWQNAVFEAALAKVRRDIDPRHYQVFDFSVNKKWSPARIAENLGIKVGQVYLTKHRVSEALKEEVERLRVTMV